MSNIHSLFNTPAKSPTPAKRGPYRKKATKADIERVVRSAVELGLTIYGMTIEGDAIHLQTRPGPEHTSAQENSADAWFDRRG